MMASDDEVVKKVSILAENQETAKAMANTNLDFIFEVVFVVLLAVNVTNFYFLV